MCLEFLHYISEINYLPQVVIKIKNISDKSERFKLASKEFHTISDWAPQHFESDFLPCFILFLSRCMRHYFLHNNKLIPNKVGTLYDGPYVK